MDYYQLLNIPRDADRKAIKKAYRQLALQYHPDVRPNDKTAENHFKEISTAYRTLINPVRRAQYDHTHDNIVNNTKIYPSDTMQNDPTTNLMLRIIFLGFGVTLLIIAIQFSLIVHYSSDSNDKSEQTSSLSNTVPEFERTTISPSQQQAIFNPDSNSPTCTLTLSNNTHTCTNTTDIHLQSLTTDHQALLMLNVGDFSNYSRVLLAITYTETTNGLTLHVGNPATDDSNIQIINQTLTISGNSETPSEYTPLLEVPEAIYPESTLFLDISPNRLRWKNDNRAEAIYSRYLFPIDPSSNEHSLYIALNRGLNVDHQIDTGIASVQIWLLPPPNTR